MATHLIPLIGSAALPDSSGSVFFEPSEIKDSNDRYKHTVLIFDDVSLKIGISTRVRVPQNYVGTPVVVVVWKATATSGAVVWDVEYTSVANAESLDPSSDQEAVTAATTTNGTARTRQETTLALTAANLAVGDELLLKLSRDGADAADTMAAAAIVEAVYLRYADA